METNPTPTPGAEDYKANTILKTMMQDHFRLQYEREELMGFAAYQMGIPAEAVYIEYEGLPNKSNLFLVNPDIKPVKGKEKSFMLKLIKCPNSPVAYNIGIFNREFKVTSSNAPEISMIPLDNVQEFDPTFDFSANLQRIIWASRGIIPGNPDSVPMNYINISNVIESNKKISRQFKCYIQATEIEKIAETFERVGDITLHKNGAQNLIVNLLDLLSVNFEKDWIKLPPVNLFRENATKGLHVN